MIDLSSGFERERAQPNCVAFEPNAAPEVASAPAPSPQAHAAEQAPAVLYRTWNSCAGLEAAARAEFPSLQAAQAYAPHEGGPNRITSSTGLEWVSGTYPDRDPQWFGPYRSEDLPPEPARPGGRRHDVGPHQ